MIEVGRIIIYNKNTGNIITDFGEMSGDVIPRESITEDELGVLNLEYGQYTDEFSRATSIKVNTETRELVFELAPKQQTSEERIEELENQLLIAEGVI